ncbi:SRP14 [Auxenochlorella protothecoides x Auxenochlorella symbiontica]
MLVLRVLGLAGEHPANTSTVRDPAHLQVNREWNNQALSWMFERHEKSGSVYVTLKRSNEKPKTKADWSQVPFRCLVRATDGKRKISTLLSEKELARFRDSYSTILRAHTHALKRRERTRGPKA